MNDPLLMADLMKATEALAAERPLPQELHEAAGALNRSQLDLAKRLLTRFLAKHPNDPDALHLMAQMAMTTERPGEAESILAKCVDRLPDFDLVRLNYAKTLHTLNKNKESLHHLERLMAKDPRSFLYRHTAALVLTGLGRHQEAADYYRRLTEDYPQMGLFWLRYADRLRAVGRKQNAIAAYRKVIELCPSLGGAYWSLADLKTFRFSEDEIATMETQLRQGDISAQNRTYFHFALAKAYADKQLYGKAFEQYAKANALRRIGVDYDPDLLSEHVAACESFYSKDFFEQRSGSGLESDSAIFVVGMHRAGSTLIEQILSSHSSVEGMGEAPEIPLLGRQLENERAPAQGLGYPEVVGHLDAATLRQFGKEYVDSIAGRRKTTRYFFVDKNPFNLWFVGIIHLILPKARIVDVRRHPMSCCFSNFTMNFGSGLYHTYRQSDLGRYYVNYVRMMAHYDRVLPNRIHRVTYERLVSDTEAEVRRLLNYIGLPFEDGCLQFHQTRRTVATPSSEQVRRPINDEGVNRWRNYEPWLGPLKAALGPVLDAYPNVPHFAD